MMMIQRIHTLAASCVALLAAALLLAPDASHAQGDDRRSDRAQLAVEEQQDAVTSRAEQSAKSLFSRLCPGRCELVGVDVVMSDPEPSSSASPGFESLGPRPYELGAESVTLSIMIDSKLPANFKSNMPRMLEYQLRDIAPEVEVHQELLDFPTPQNRPMPPTPEEPQQRTQRPPPMPQPQPQPPMPQPQVDDEPEEEPAEPAEADGWWDQMPAILGAIIPWVGLMLVLLLIFALGLIFMRRLAELFFEHASRPGDDGAYGKAASSRGVDADELRAELDRSRSVRNRVLRRWVVDSPRRVAQLVQLVGPQILSDLKSDEQMRKPLEAVSDEVATMSDELDDDDAGELAREVRARLNAARVVHADPDLSREWAFLEGISASRLRHVLRGCTPAETLYVVAKLPGPLRASYMEGLDEDERRKFFSDANLETLDRQEAVALSARLREAVEEVSHAGGEVELRATLMGDLVSSLRIDEQLDSVGEMLIHRPEVAERLLSMMCLEATIGTVPKDALAETVHALPVETLTNFAGGTNARLRDALLDATPSDKREAVQTELSLDIPVSRRTFLDARQSLTERLQEVMRRDGHDLAAANRRALQASQAHDKTSHSPQEVPS